MVVFFLAPPPKTDKLLDILQLLLVWTAGLVNPSADRKEQRRVIIVFIIIVTSLYCSYMQQLYGSRWSEGRRKIKK